MDKKYIKSVNDALTQVYEKKLDPVNKKSAKGDFADRQDKDINNDGSVTKSDKYLHKRRKAISKKMDTETTVEEAKETVADPAAGAKPKEIKQGKEKSATKDTSKLDNVSSPDEVDAVDAINDNKASEKKSAAQADADAVNEDYKSVDSRWKTKIIPVAQEIVKLAQKIVNQNVDTTDGMIYGDCKYLVRELENCRDYLETRISSPKKKVAETTSHRTVTDALRQMAENSRDDHYKGATKPEGMDDKWSKGAKKFAATHKVDDVDDADVNKAIAKNSKEVGLSLQRTPNYRHNDSKIGDKKPVGNDGK